MAMVAVVAAVVVVLVLVGVGVGVGGGGAGVGVGGCWCCMVCRSEGGAAQFTPGAVVRTTSWLGPVRMSEARVIVRGGGRFFASVARALLRFRTIRVVHKSRGCNSAQI